jgi:hypothetical protein
MHQQVDDVTQAKMVAFDGCPLVGQLGPVGDRLQVEYPFPRNADLRNQLVQWFMHWGIHFARSAGRDDRKRAAALLRMPTRTQLRIYRPHANNLRAWQDARQPLRTIRKEANEHDDKRHCGRRD